MTKTTQKTEEKTKTTWRTMKLGDIADIKNGKTNTQDAVMHGAYPLFDRSMQIKRSNKYLFDTTAVILPGEGAEFLPRFFNGKFDLHQRAYAIIPKKDVNPHFVFYSVLVNRKIFSQHAVGSTVKSLRMPIIQGVPIRLPTIDEQKRIAGVLAAFDERIENNNRIIKTLEEMAQVIFKEYAVVPAKNGLPEGWKMQTIGDNFTVTAGLAYKAESIVAAVDGARPLMTMGSITVGRRYTNEQVKYYRGDIAQRYDLNSGDLLVASHDVTQERRFIGYPAIIHPGVQKPVQGNNLYALRANDRSVNEFFYQLLLTPAYRAYILGAAKGSNIVFISKGTLESYSFPMPPQRVLRPYLQRANALVSRIEIAYQENQKLVAMRDLLLPRLMSGEIRV